LGREYYDTGRYGDAARTMDRVLAKEPDHFRALMVKGRSLIALNRASDARVLFLRAQAIEPGNRAPGNYVRLTETLALDEPGRGALTAGVARLHGAGTLAERIATQPFDWLLVSGGDPNETDAIALNAPAMQRAGCARIAGNSYWRREALAGLAESGLIADPAHAARWMDAFVPRCERVPRSRKAVVVMAAAETDDATALSLPNDYADLGYDTAVVPAADSIPALRRSLLEEEPALVHVVSGAGYAVAGALAFANIPFIYGAHSWADMLSDDGDGAFDESGLPHPRREFDFVLAHAAAVYATTRELRDIIEQCFDVRCAIFTGLKKAA
jgi:hypothetical protein